MYRIVLCVLVVLICACGNLTTSEGADTAQPASHSDDRPIPVFPGNGPSSYSPRVPPGSPWAEGPTEGRAKTFGREWYSAGCLVNANDDEVLDIAGWSGNPMAQHQLTLVDGRNGEILSFGKSYGNSGNLICASRDTIIVARQDFSIEAFSAKNLTPTWTKSLSDRVYRHWPGERCIFVETHDDRREGINLADGSNTQCDGRTKGLQPESSAQYADGLIRQDTLVKARGDVEYSVTGRSPVLRS